MSISPCVETILDLPTNVAGAHQYLTFQTKNPGCLPRQAVFWLHSRHSGHTSVSQRNEPGLVPGMRTQAHLVNVDHLGRLLQSVLNLQCWGNQIHRPTAGILATQRRRHPTKKGDRAVLAICLENAPCLQNGSSAWQLCS